MKTFSILSLVYLCLACSLALAHPGGHGKPKALNKEQAIEVANDAKNKLIIETSVNEKWKSAPVHTAAIKRIEYRKNWVVTYVLKEKNYLDIVMSESGDFVSFNERSDQ